MTCQSQYEENHHQRCILFNLQSNTFFFKVEYSVRNSPTQQKMPPQAPSSSRLNGKVALVTGSGRGMGRQNALELASRGASLVINYAKSADAAQKVVSEIEALGSKAVAIKGDVSKPAEIVSLFDQAVKHYGRLDIVVSNSGVESFGHISEITPEEFDRVFHVNTRGQLFTAQQAYKHLAPGGRLVMLSSISASARSIKNHAIYSGSKNAVEAFVRCLAVGKWKMTSLIGFHNHVCV